MGERRRRRRPDLDERFTLHPKEGEEVLRQLLVVTDTEDDESPDEDA